MCLPYAFHRNFMNWLAVLYPGNRFTLRVIGVQWDNKMNIQQRTTSHRSVLFYLFIFLCACYLSWWCIRPNQKSHIMSKDYHWSPYNPHWLKWTIPHFMHNMYMHITTSKVTHTCIILKGCPQIDLHINFNIICRALTCIRHFASHRLTTTSLTIFVFYWEDSDNF